MINALSIKSGTVKSANTQDRVHGLLLAEPLDHKVLGIGGLDC
jgi:hypothetical protein